jgi:hypothetical protein
VTNPDEVAVDEELWCGLPTQVDIPGGDPFGLGPYPQPGDWSAAYARMAKLRRTVDNLNGRLVSGQRKREREADAAAKLIAHQERRIEGMERELRKRAAVTARMRRAHLADRERMIRTHRDLTAVISRVRDMALAGVTDPDRILAVLGDTGVCTITAEDQRPTTFAERIAEIRAGQAAVYARALGRRCPACRAAPGVRCTGVGDLPHSRHAAREEEP